MHMSKQCFVILPLSEAGERGQKTRRGAAATDRGLTQQIKGAIPTLWAFPIRGFTIKFSWISAERKPPQ
ncbi:hypothetical protein MHYP_G00193940 [Metynnis hypsauchen]